MREWTYSYKTPDGLRHEAEMTAPSKDDVYSELRKRGIRAIKVTERITPVVRKGFSGLRKRDWCLIAFALVAMSTSIFLITGILLDEDEGAVAVRPNRYTGIESNIIEITNSGERIAKPSPRKQFSTRNVPADAFKFDSERFLARYALPGVLPQPLDNPEDMLTDIYEALDAPIIIDSSDSRDLALLKRVVAGIKEEAGTRLYSGASFSDIVEWLESRQKMEAEYRTRILEGVGSEAEKKKMLSALSLPLP